MDRFWSKVNRSAPNGCWEWTASLRNGYGQFKLNGRQQASHRISWGIHNGKIPKGGMKGTMCVCHKCDNRKCVNPDHLFLGNMKDNVLDMHNKNRNADVNGANNPACRLSEETISNIRSRYAFGIETHAGIGRLYGVSKSHVGNIIRHQRRSK